MSKHGKRKNKNKNRKFNQTQFVNVFCNGCLLCGQKPDHKPSFCYSELYRHEPNAFRDGPYKNLLQAAKFYFNTGKKLDDISVPMFKNLFCHTGICYNGSKTQGGTCTHHTDCYSMFRAQLGLATNKWVFDSQDSIEPAVQGDNKKGTKYSCMRKRKGKKSRYVAQAYPSSFSSDNQDFKDEIQRILYGDNSKQQDKDKESTKRDSGSADRNAESGQSQVS